jgi:hypothetical protein
VVVIVGIDSPLTLIENVLRRTLSPETQTTQTTESTFPAGNRLPTWIPVTPADSQPSLGQPTGPFNSVVGHDRSAD